MNDLNRAVPHMPNSVSYCILCFCFPLTGWWFWSYPRCRLWNWSLFTWAYNPKISVMLYWRSYWGWWRWLWWRRWRSGWGRGRRRRWGKWSRLGPKEGSKPSRVEAAVKQDVWGPEDNLHWSAFCFRGKDEFTSFDKPISSFLFVCLLIFVFAS